MLNAIRNAFQETTIHEHVEARRELNRLRQVKARLHEQTKRVDAKIAHLADQIGDDYADLSDSDLLDVVQALGIPNDSKPVELSDQQCEAIYDMVMNITHIDGIPIGGPT
jgi:hypothetical protein